MALDMAAGDQVLLGRQVLEHAPALEHLRDAEPRHVEGAQPIDALVLEGDAALGDLTALGAQHARDGLQRGGLAGAVGRPAAW